MTETSEEFGDIVEFLELVGFKKVEENMYSLETPLFKVNTVLKGSNYIDKVIISPEETVKILFPHKIENSSIVILPPIGKSLSMFYNILVDIAFNSKNILDPSKWTEVEDLTILKVLSYLSKGEEYGFKIHVKDPTLDFYSNILMIATLLYLKEVIQYDPLLNRHYIPYLEKNFSMRDIEHISDGRVYARLLITHINVQNGESYILGRKLGDLIWRYRGYIEGDWREDLKTEVIVRTGWNLVSGADSRSMYLFLYNFLPVKTLLDLLKEGWIPPLKGLLPRDRIEYENFYPKNLLLKYLELARESPNLLDDRVVKRIIRILTLTNCKDVDPSTCTVFFFKRKTQSIKESPFSLHRSRKTGKYYIVPKNNRRIKIQITGISRGKFILNVDGVEIIGDIDESIVGKIKILDKVRRKKKRIEVHSG